MTAFFVLVPGFLQSPRVRLRPRARPSAGLILLPFSAAMIAGGPVRGRARHQRGAACCRCGSASPSARSASPAWPRYTRSQLVFAAWLPIMGAGMAFALAAIGALVIDHSRPEETGVTSGMNTIMRTSGAAIGAQIAAVIVSAHPGTGDGYTIAFAMGALGLLAALAPTLLLEPPPAPGRSCPRPRSATATLDRVAGARERNVERGLDLVAAPRCRRPRRGRRSIAVHGAWRTRRMSVLSDRRPRPAPSIIALTSRPTARSPARLNIANECRGPTLNERSGVSSTRTRTCAARRTTLPARVGDLELDRQAVPARVPEQVARARPRARSRRTVVRAPAQQRGRATAS